MKLPDTSAVVDIDREGVDRKVRKLDDQARHLLSMVTVTKLRLGVELQYETGTEARENAMDQLDRLLARFDIQPISRSLATSAAELIATLRERGQRLNDLHDIYIRATARTEQRPVITANVDDFERMDGVQVIDWEQFWPGLIVRSLYPTPGRSNTLPTKHTTMATQEYRIVSAEDSDIHDEPHIEGSRVTVRDIHARVETRGLRPQRVAERFNLDVANVYESLAYYHNNPEEMARAGNRHEQAKTEAKRRSSLQPPDN